MSAKRSGQTTPTPLQERGVFVLSQLGYHVATRAAEVLDPLGLQPAHYGVLMHLSRQEGLTQQRLADSLGLHRNAMVGLIDELEGRTLVRRQQDARDRRAHHIYLTDHAHEVLAEADLLLDELEHEILDGFRPDERAPLVAMLRRAADRAGLPEGIHPGLRRRRGPRTAE